MVRFCICGVDDEEVQSRATGMILKYRLRQSGPNRTTSNFPKPDSSPPIVNQEIPENLVLEEQIEDNPLEANQPNYIPPPRAAMPLGSDGKDLAGASLFLTDTDVLDCHICCLPLTVPVYQCENGHTACGTCWSKDDISVCPDCRIPKGSRRCRAMENLIESVISLCRFARNGCMARVIYSDKINHEKACTSSPFCVCPHRGCNHVNKSKELYDHFSSCHFQCSNDFLFNRVVPAYIYRRKATFTSEEVLLRESKKRMLFVLHYFVQGDWLKVTVVCVAPVWSTRVFKFDLSATPFSGTGEFGKKVEIKSAIVTNAPRKLLVPPAGQSLWVPYDYGWEFVRYAMQLTIWNE